MLGRARVDFVFNDMSLYSDRIALGYVSYIGIFERGPIGQPLEIASEPEFERWFGLNITDSLDPLGVRTALKQGGKFIILRTAHYGDAADATSLTAAKSTVTLQDRGSAPVSAIVESAVGPFTITAATPGSTTGTEVGPYTFGVGTEDQFKITVGSRDPVTFTMVGSLVPLTGTDGVVDQINAETEGLTASALDNKLLLTANDPADDIVIGTVSTDCYGVLGLTEGTYAASAGTDSLVVAIHSQSDQTFTLTPGTRSAAQVVSDLSTLTHATVAVVGGKVKITTTETGVAATVQITSASTADTALGFDNTSHTGSVATAEDTLEFSAINEGVWGDSLTIAITDSVFNPTTRFDVRVTYSRQSGLGEYFSDLSMDPTSDRYICNIINGSESTVQIDRRSQLVTVTNLASTNVAPNNRPAVVSGGTPLSSGDNGLTDLCVDDFIGDSLALTGLYAFGKSEMISQDIMAPSETSVEMAQAGAVYATLVGMRFYHQIPQGLNPDDAVAWRQGDSPYDHTAFNDSRLSLWYGHPLVYDSMDDTKKYISSLPLLAACLSKTDMNYSSIYAPVGPRRGVVSLVEGIDYDVGSFIGQADLFALNGINYITNSKQPGIKGSMFWEQRTTLQAASAFRELNVVRFLDTFKIELMPVLNTFLFEPNRPDTWAQIDRILRPKLEDYKARGCVYDFWLQTDKDAWFQNGVLMNAQLNTGQTIDQGEYHCRICLEVVRAILYFELEVGVMKTGDNFVEFTQLRQLPGWVRA